MTSIPFVPSRIDPAPLPGSRPDLMHVDAGMTLLSGTVATESPGWHEGPLEQGLKLVLVQSGRLCCRVPGQPEHCVSGPSLCLIVNDAGPTTEQLYCRDAPLRYTIVQFGIETLGQDAGLLPAHPRPAAGGPRMMSCPASKALQALAVQIATCQFEGAVRAYYLKGKALELMALGAQLMATRRAPLPAGVRVTSSDVERIHAASEILTHDLERPPTLDALATRVGLNPRKLTAGFRKVFGTSVHAYLQECRLKKAHGMLCDEDSNVSTVAYRVGYSPAHFSVAFRKRYGVSPREIRASLSARDELGGGRPGIESNTPAA
ncbi:helix-turn-helix domain-containing protein [Burkholderia perseverans]|uniref:helix-turn-helix domain-containing protein n=1 Tax=Burkholderia perseverans TaxID=2615214 RepID=UPI001FEE84FB|nr:AraC family transcriptional regulator [Burkholderia perseverans]